MKPILVLSLALATTTGCIIYDNDGSEPVRERGATADDTGIDTPVDNPELPSVTLSFLPPQAEQGESFIGSLTVEEGDLSLGDCHDVVVYGDASVDALIARSGEVLVSITANDDATPGVVDVLVELNGLPASVSLDPRGPSASDSVTIKGTAGNDALTLTGTTLDNGTTTLDLGGVENLTLDISNGGADTISVDQDFTGSARSIIVTGDLSDDVVSLQSTTKQQQVNIFSEGSYNAQVQEVLGGDLVLEEVLSSEKRKP